MEKRVVRAEKSAIDIVLQKGWLSLSELAKEIKCPEDAEVLKEVGCAVLCAKGLRCIVWIGKKSASVQMSTFKIRSEKSLSKDLEL